MSPLFGKKSDRDADAQAAGAEVQRLVSLSADELAVELVPAFGPDGARKKGDTVATMQVIQWLMASQPRGADTKPLIPAVQAALERLEDAGLLESRSPGTGTGVKYYRLSPEGEQAAADGSVAARLGA